MLICVCLFVLQLADLQTDNEDLQRSVQQLKKKSQKLTGELQDTKLHLESLQSRNHDLEKKQRKSVSNVLRLFCLLITNTHHREFHALFLVNFFPCFFISDCPTRWPAPIFLKFDAIQIVARMVCNLRNCISGENDLDFKHLRSYHRGIM